MFCLFMENITAQIMVKDIPPNPKLTERDTALLDIIHVDSICQRTARYGKIRQQYSLKGVKMALVKSILGETDEVEEEYSLRTKKIMKVYTYQLASCHSACGGHIFKARAIFYVEDGYVVAVQNVCESG